MSGTGSSSGGGDFLTDGSVEISWTPFLLLLPNQPKPPLFSPALDLPGLAATLCVLPDDCDVAVDERLPASSSLALRAFLAPTVSACWGGTSKVGNMSTCQCGPASRAGRRIANISTPYTRRFM
jgi:hypothetical protein